MMRSEVLTRECDGPGGVPLRNQCFFFPAITHHDSVFF